MRIPCRFCEAVLPSMKEYIAHLSECHGDRFFADVERTTNAILKDPKLLAEVQRLSEDDEVG